MKKGFVIRCLYYTLVWIQTQLLVLNLTINSYKNTSNILLCFPAYYTAALITNSLVNSVHLASLCYLFQRCIENERSILFNQTPDQSAFQINGKKVVIQSSAALLLIVVVVWVCEKQGWILISAAGWHRCVKIFLSQFPCGYIS